MYVERTSYWAKPGNAEQVLAVRRRASQIRVSLGLPAGTIFVKASGQAEGPDVQWECIFHSLEEQARDLNARDTSADFQRIRDEMGAVRERFERHLVCRDRDISET